MDGVLEFLTPEEIADALRFVEVWEKAGHMAQEETEEWRRWIEAWRRRICPRPGASSILTTRME